MGITVMRDNNIFGWVRKGGCANPACKKAMKQGRMFHALPAGYAVTLPDYHFKTEEEARDALLALPYRIPMDV